MFFMWPYFAIPWYFAYYFQLIFILIVISGLTFILLLFWKGAYFKARLLFVSLKTD